HLALGVSNCRAAAAVVSQVVEAERLGVNRAVISEDVGCRDGFQLCALAGAVTAGIRFTLGVTNPYLRSPVSLAVAAATLEALIGPRFELGLGSSSPDIIHGQLGLEYGTPATVMRQAVLAARTEYETQTGSRLGITMAAMGPKMLRLAGEVADRVLLNTGT